MWEELVGSQLAPSSLTLSAFSPHSTKALLHFTYGEMIQVLIHSELFHALNCCIYLDSVSKWVHLEQLEWTNSTPKTFCYCHPPTHRYIQHMYSYSLELDRHGMHVMKNLHSAHVYFLFRDSVCILYLLQSITFHQYSWCHSIFSNTGESDATQQTSTVYIVVSVVVFMASLVVFVVVTACTCKKYLYKKYLHKKYLHKKPKQENNIYQAN